MAWSGRTRQYAKVGGRHGGLTRVGDYLVPRHAFYEIEGENGHPDLLMRFEVRDSRPECVEVQITAKNGGRGVRTADLHSLLVDALTTMVFSGLAAELDKDNPGSAKFSAGAGDEERAWAALGAVEDAVKTAGRGVARAELEQVAQVYREHLDSSPTRAVREVLNYASDRTAARRVQQARDAGLLPPTTPGKRQA